MAESQSKTKTGKVGEVVKTKSGAVVVRPDGSRVTAGSGYVLDTTGTFEIDGQEYKVK